MEGTASSLSKYLVGSGCVALRPTELRTLAMKASSLIAVSHAHRRRQWQPTPVLFSGKSRGRRSLVGYSPWGRKASGTTERLDFHFSVSCIGEGNGNPLQYSCLENPRDRRDWWAAVYGVKQGRTQLKQLSSSSSISVTVVLQRQLFWGLLCCF